MAGWLRRHPIDGTPLRRLICLPHAGGTAAAFASWLERLPAGIELVVVQYPGRQDRIGEDFIEDMDAMADLIAAELRDLTDLPMAMFGHSMGSAVAYEVAARLERDPGVVMDTVFVSARTAPHRRDGEPNHLLDDERLIEALRMLGGADDDVYDRPKLWPLILPPLRADLRLLDRYRPVEVERLRAPIVAFGGTDDHTCAVADLDAWRDATVTGLRVQEFPGGHHYLAANEADVLATLGKYLEDGLKTPTERVIVVMWEHYLGASGIGTADDFFGVGGNSLVGMKILEAISKRFGVEIGPMDFYLAPTPAALAAKVDAR